MRSRAIGRTGVVATELGFGTAPIGNLYREVDDDTARAALDAAWIHGVRYFDTAPHYGLGLAERRLGAALADKPRAAYAISTKVGRLLEPNPAPTGSDLAVGGFAVKDDYRRRFDFSADGVRRSLESSLNHLGTDHVDIALVHDPDAHMDEAIRHAVPALISLRDEGVVRAVGAAMNNAAPLRRFVEQSDIDVVMVAGRWTLIDRGAGPLLECCVRNGVSALVAAPYNSGLLAQDWPPDNATFNYQPADANVLRTARGAASVASDHGIRLPVAALQFPLRHRAATAVVAGFRTAAELEQAVRWLRTPVPEAAWAAFDDLLRGG